MQMNILMRKLTKFPAPPLNPYSRSRHCARFSRLWFFLFYNANPGALVPASTASAKMT